MIIQEKVKAITIYGYNPVQPTRFPFFGNMIFIRIHDHQDKDKDLMVFFKGEKIVINPNGVSDLSNDEFNDFMTAEMQQFIETVAHASEEVIKGEEWNMNFASHNYESDIERMVKGDFGSFKFNLKNAVEHPSMVTYDVTFRVSSIQEQGVLLNYAITSNFNLGKNPEAVFHIFKILHPLMNLEQSDYIKGSTVIKNPFLKTVVEVKEFGVNLFERNADSLHEGSYKRVSYHHSLLEPVAKFTNH